MSTGMLVVIVSFFVFLFLGVPCMFALGLPSLIWLALNPNMPVTNACDQYARVS